jgi:DNA-binding YbaB/EbfC family protein
MNINPLDILKNAGKIQEQMGPFQEKLAAMSATGSSGGGMVEIDLNGKFEMTAVRIAPEVTGSGDIEMLQDLIIAAYANGREKIQETQNREIGAMAGNFGIQGLSGLFGNT